MENQGSKSDLSLFETIDFRAFFETVRLRWWVIPAVVAASVGFLQAQESDLRTEPASYVVSRSYEVGYPQFILTSVGVQLSSVREFPEPSTQILILKSNETREEIANQLGIDVEVQIPDNYETPFTLSCNQPVQADCERAIEAYLAKAAEIRRGAVTTALENLKELLAGLQETSPDPLLPPQIAAIDTLLNDLEVRFALVDGFEQAIGPTVEQVRRPTVLMGVAAGLLISLLILLQLTYTDSRVRSVRQLVRLIGNDSYLGRVTSTDHVIRDRRIAVALHHGLRTTSASQLRYLPLRRRPLDETPLMRLSTMVGSSHVLSKPFSELSVPELSTTAPDQADILVVQRNRDYRKDVTEALMALQRTERKLVGVLLVG